MALIRVMLGTARIYLEAHEARLALNELQRAYTVARRMRPTRKMIILRAHIVQCIERARVCLPENVSRNRRNAL